MYNQVEQWRILRCFTDANTIIYSDPPLWYQLEYPNDPYCDLTVMSVQSNMKSDIQIYPNPVIDLVYFDNLKDREIGEVRVFDISGKPVFHSRSLLLNNGFSLEEFKSGLYFLSLETRNGKQFNFKVIKE